jgi:hypothetical protein
MRHEQVRGSADPEPGALPDRWVWLGQAAGAPIDIDDEVARLVLGPELQFRTMHCPFVAQRGQRLGTRRKLSEALQDLKAKGARETRSQRADA